MATKLAETRHLYSWWWDSHISPKNSKWLQENLTDTDGKVKSMIKIINEDADSFAKRAEMYYKKRPELMKLVEDFYRAYRALAERYDHATGELRLAHRTMIEAFPNQMPYMLSDEPNSTEMFQSGESTLRELKPAEFRLRQGEEDGKDSSFKLDLRTMILNESERAVKVEAEMQRLKLALAKMEAERDSALAEYNQISDKLLNLEKELCSAEEAEKKSEMEEKLEVVCKQNVEAESEIKALREEISRLSKEKGDAYLRYQQCMEMIAKLQNELMEAKEELKRLKGAENQCVLLEEVNKSLKVEANERVQEIAEKDQKLLAKHNELEMLMMRLRDEEARFSQVEEELNALQKMHLRSQKDMELEIEGLKLASCAVEKDMKHEILGLKEIKEKLEIEFKRQEEQNESLQEEFSNLKQELESSGIDPNCINSSIKDLQNENLRMKQKSDEANAEKEALLKRLYDVKFELESSKEKMKALQEFCSTLGGEKASLIAEKSALLSQLQIITESMQKLLEKNVSLETSLHCANIELQGLKVKSKGLEDFVQFLKDEKSNLQTERNSLVYRLERLETRFTKLENKYFDLEKARDLARDQVQELKISLACETRLLGLENRVHQLQEGNCEDQVEKAVSAQVEIFMLKKIMKDMEERDSSLLAECHRHVEAAKFSEKLISDLESENMMQHLEIEYLLDRVETLRRGICKVLKAVEIDHVKIDPEIILPHVCRKLTENKDESNELLIQNNVLLTVIKEMSADAVRSNWFLHEKLANLEEEKQMLKEKNSSANEEVLSLSNQSVVLKSSLIQTVLELENVKEGHRDLGEKLVIREAENIQLRENVQKLEEKSMELSACKDQLKKECSVEKVQSKTREKEIVLLREAKGSLENEVSVLNQEIESYKTRELFLNSKLYEISSEFEKREAEATSFYSDLHMSSVREAFLEDKVQELSGLYEDLQKVESKRSMEIERLNEKISFLESDREGLKSNLAAYLPFIASLKDNVASLEQTQAKACSLAPPHLQDAMDQSYSVSDGLSELQELQRRVKAIKNSLHDSIQTKIKLAKQKSRNNSQTNPTVQSRSRELGAGTSEPRNGIHMKDIPLDHVSASPSPIRRRKSSRLSDQMLELWEAPDVDSSQNLPLYKSQPRSSPPRRKRSDSNGGGIEKELGVDKMELSKNITTETKQGGNRKIILVRLASDAQKLTALQNSVQELKTKMETNKKSKAAKNIEFKSLKSQIYNVESSVMQLVSMNTELTKTVKGSASSSLDFARSRELVEVEQALRRKMLEQTRRDSERIGSLQLEMEKMQSMVVKMEDDNCKKNNEVSKGAKNGLLRTRTGIILREFVYGPSRSRKQKKQRFCGCFKQSHKQV